MQDTGRNSNKDSNMDNDMNNNANNNANNNVNEQPLSDDKRLREMYDKLVGYEKTIHEQNQKRIKIGLRCIYIIPLFFLVLLMIVPFFGLMFMFLERFQPERHYYVVHCALDDLIDRKSTRLNSSHRT